MRGVTWRRFAAAGVAAAIGAVAGPVGAAMASPVSPSTAGPRVEVVVRATAAADHSAELAAEKLGARIGLQLGLIHAFTASVPESALGQVSAIPGVLSVTKDAPLQLQSNSYDPGGDQYSLYNIEKETGVRSVWNRGDGSGVDVALIDSGVTPVEGLESPGQVIYGPDLTEESQNPATANLDTYGHGTFLAGIIAGRDPGVDPTSPWTQWDSSDFIGVAPEAGIVSVKVADAQGMTDVSQVIAGIDWVVQNAHAPGMNIRVLNLSFGTDSTQSYDVDPLAYAAEVAWQNGIVVVVSAGNDGVDSDGLTMPAADPYLIAVGSADISGSQGPNSTSVASYSSSGDGTRNPDLLAPGDHIQSLRVPGSYVDDTYGSTGQIASRYFRGSGTSEAAAFTSGVVADLLSQRPYLTPDEVKSVLVGTARQLPMVSSELQGAGLIRPRNAANAWANPSAVQSFPKSTGLGSLDASRGSYHLTVRGDTLSGEQDIFGQTFDSATMAAAEAAGDSWSGGTWNGSTWFGSTWTGDDWTGSSWSSDNWSNGTWNGSTWNGSTWSGSTWSGSTWSGSTWSGSTWSGSTWSSDYWY